MQPFGLLNFLKLALQPNEGETTPSTTAPDEPLSQNESSPTPSPSSPNITAYQDFIDKHERTAKRLKK
ncbi:MAG: hypothetical protein IJY11_02535 [Clostridia bacterium]|nr:hypothetical protein [Clostridia bacterium]